MAEYTTTKDGKRPDMRTKAAKDVWQRCQDRWRYVNTVDEHNIQDAREDTEFVWVRGKQWPDGERLAREANKRPWLEINQMPQFVNLVVNEQRESRPQIKIRPGDDDASKDMADIYEGYIRAIERDSNASAVYDSGFEQAVTGGRGYWRIITDYEREDSFKQCAYIRRIPDQGSVRLDPDYQQPDASDIEWGYILEVMQRDEFKRKYPGRDPLDFNDENVQALRDKWIVGEEGVIVADYYEKVYTKRTLVLLDNGKTAFKDDLVQDEHPMGVIDPQTGNYPETYGGARIVDERETQTCRVDWHKVYGGGILETIAWAGKYIPIVMVIGVETVIDGKRYYQGLIRRARDVQTMFNFWQTKATEHLALSPNSQWLTPKGSVDGFETIWDTANVRYMTRLPYNADPSRPEPRRLDPPPPQAGVLEQANQCRQDFYTTIGIYPPNLAQEGKNEASGIAEQNRRTVGSQQTFHFADNLARAIAHTGCILVDLIPKINDVETELPQVAYDGKTSTAKVNQPNPTTGGRYNDLSQGTYKVVVDVGPGYTTRRQETAAQMLAFMQAYPAAAPLLGDLLARAQDWDEADKIANRLQVMLPPQIQMMEQQAQGDPKYAALLTALQNLQQQSQGTIQALQGQLQQANLAVQNLQVKELQAKATAAVTKMQGAKTQLGAIVGQHNAEIRAAAEQQRTGVEVYNAETQRLGEALDFILGLIDAHQKQAQIDTQRVAAEAQALQPEAQAITGSP
jgi:hypothetical protein